MIKSMTGFGRGECTDGNRNAIIEIRTVNHRYCDLSVRMSRKYSFAEEKIKSAVKETIKRGKVDISVIVEDLAEKDVTVRFNRGIASQYVENVRLLKEEFGLTGDISAEFIAGLPDVMKSMPDVDDEDEITALLVKAAREACINLDEMRCKEGGKLAEDLLMRGGLVREHLDKIREYAPKVVENYTMKLKERMSELLENSAAIPEERILSEAAIFADKSNITEEIVRLDSHMIQLKDILSASSQPVGKKLDFLVQEMNREANTIGSKANSIDITQNVLDIKSEVEKIREQIQNIE